MGLRQALLEQLTNARTVAVELIVRLFSAADCWSNLITEFTRAARQRMWPPYGLAILESWPIDSLGACSLAADIVQRHVCRPITTSQNDLN